MPDQVAKTGLVVSAHSADFVWRAGGAIALYAKRGWKIRIISLSLGARGESAKMWREGNMSMEKVKAARIDEAKAAADILGADSIDFYDLQDYPMRVPDEIVYRLADEFRSLRPEWVLTHGMEDPYNADHPLTSQVTQEARVIAQAHGHKYPEPPIGAPQVYMFEPHQTEQCNFKPQMILDISEVWEQKRKAFETQAAQEYMWDYYTHVALNRGTQGARNSGRKMKYGEAYQRIFSYVGDVFV
ncbi:MAG TPA: PIG-L deacetylase family protein [Alphaproteobacteria bacterium]|jgi:4-oxalomesaconate hydratase